MISIFSFFLCVCASVKTMFNEYLNHSNQCASYYGVIRKEEIVAQQNDTARFKQKWLDISGSYPNRENNSSMSHGSISHANANTAILNSSSNANSYNSAKATSSLQHSLNFNPQSTYQQNQKFHMDKQQQQQQQQQPLNNSNDAKKGASFYAHQPLVNYEQQSSSRHQQHQSNSMHHMAPQHPNQNITSGQNGKGTFSEVILYLVLKT